MFHHACDMHFFAVAERVDVKLDCSGEVAVQQYGAVARDDDGLGDVALKLGHVAHDFHSAATENVGGADDQREADIFRNGKRLRVCGGDAVFRLLEAEFIYKLLKTLAIFGEVDRVGRCAEDRDAFIVECLSDLERGLAAELDDDAVERAVFLLNTQDFHHVFES